MFRPKRSPCRYDPERQEPIIRCSICTGEQSAGFRDKATGRVEEVMLIRDERDEQAFRREYGIEQPIRRVY